MPNLDTEQITKTTTPIAEKLAVGVIMLGALAMMVAAFISLPGVRRGLERTPVSRISSEERSVAVALDFADSQEYLEELEYGQQQEADYSQKQNIAPVGNVANLQPGEESTTLECGTPTDNVLCVPQEFASIQDAADAIPENIQVDYTVLVDDGNYAGFEVRRGGTGSNARLIFKSKNPLGAVLSEFQTECANTKKKNYRHMCLNGLEWCASCATRGQRTGENRYVVVDGFKFVAGPEVDGYVFDHSIAIGGADHLYIINNYFSPSLNSSVFGGRNYYLHIEGNEFVGQGHGGWDAHGLYLNDLLASFHTPGLDMEGSDMGYYTIRNNIFRDSNSWGGYIKLRSRNPGYYIHDNVIENNIFYANSDLSHDNFALALESGIKDTDVRNNIMVAAKRPSYWMIQLGDQQVKEGVTHGFDPSPVDGTKIYNNTIIAPDNAGIGIGGAWTDHDADPATPKLPPQAGNVDNVMFNNIIIAGTAVHYVTDTAPNPPFCVACQIKQDNLEIDTDDPNLDTILAALFMDVSDPNPENNDYHIKLGSDAYNTGIPSIVAFGMTILAPGFDFEGDSRPQGGIFDIGFDEYNEGMLICTDTDNDDYCLQSSASGCDNTGICEVGWDDCRDDLPLINPGAPEICDGEDNNCNGQTDEIGCNVSLDEDFEDYSIGIDPPLWLSTGANNSLTEQSGLFSIAQDTTKVLGTSSTLTNIHSHYIGPNADLWSNYEFTGKMKLSDLNGGIGVTAYSDYPNSDTYYRLRKEPSTGYFVLSKHPDAQKNDLVTTKNDQISPVQNTWYSFRLRVENNTTNNQTLVKARIWPSSQTEDTGLWNIEANDATANRITHGTVGVWTMLGGVKSFDDFQVTEITADGGGGGGTRKINIQQEN
ncbi:MopE-related protein [Patescibacteria group bacterium]